MMKRLFLFLFIVLAVCPVLAQVSPQTNSQFMATPSSGSGYLGLRAITPLDFNNGTGASGSTCLSGLLTWIACSSGATGAAGGSLAGTYPNPSIASGVALTSPVVTGGMTLSGFLTSTSTLSGSFSADVYFNPNTITIGAISDPNHNIWASGTQCNANNSGFSGQLFCTYDYLNVTVPSPNNFPNNIYVGRFIYAVNSANFTSTNSSLTALNPNCLNTGTGLNSLGCAEIDVTTLQPITGGKWGLKIVQASNDAYQGAVKDAALYIANQAGAVGWKDIIHVDAGAVSAGGTIFNTPYATLAYTGDFTTGPGARLFLAGATTIPTGAIGAVNGELAVTGAAGGFLIGDRAGTGSGWLWYATGGTATLLNLTYGTNALTINSANNVTFTAQTLFSASLATNAAINIPQGTAPTTPNNGDVWMTSSGLYYRFNGTTHGPL